MSRYLSDDSFDHFEAEITNRYEDRRSRRKRKPKPAHAAKKGLKEVVEALADEAPFSAGFQMTYVPARFEEGWLQESLQPLAEQALIIDVLSKVKGGKEANVYCCEADPAIGTVLVAAKVYRPQMFRNLRNDAMYKEGRTLLSANGHAIKENEMRVMRAVSRKTGYGEQVAHTSWLMHEFNTLQQLHAAGGAVPKAYGAGPNVIAMDFIGDQHSAAPPLSAVTLESAEAPGLFRTVIRNIELMLRHDLVHGDLSAFNILYWEGAVTLIDFPQVTGAKTNSRALHILQRDIERVCEYFASQGVTGSGDLPCDPDALLRRFRERYFRREQRNRQADFSRFTADES